jgi:hypothetical protein
LVVLLGLLIAGSVVESTVGVRAQDATPAGDPDANKAVVLRYLSEVWDKGNTDVAYETLAPDFVWRFGTTEIFQVGPDASKAHADNLNAEIQEMGLTVDIALAEGDLVAVRWTFLGILPAGEGTPQTTSATPQVLCTGNDIYRVEDGLIAELWQESASCDE